MITKEKIIEILSNYSSYADSSLGNIIQEEKHDIIAEDILSKLRQPPVSWRSELLLAFTEWYNNNEIIKPRSLILKDDVLVFLSQQ